MKCSRCYFSPNNLAPYALLCSCCRLLSIRNTHATFRCDSRDGSTALVSDLAACRCKSVKTEKDRVFLTGFFDISTTSPGTIFVILRSNDASRKRLSGDAFKTGISHQMAKFTALSGQGRELRTWIFSILRPLPRDQFPWPRSRTMRLCDGYPTVFSDPQSDFGGQRFLIKSAKNWDLEKSFFHVFHPFRVADSCFDDGIRRASTAVL